MGEGVDAFAGGFHAGFEAVGEGEELVDAADDFLLFGEGWKFNGKATDGLAFTFGWSTAVVPPVSRSCPR